MTRNMVGLLAVVAALALASCKPGVPRGYLSESEMEDYLYDYHLAQAMANQSGNPEEHAVAYETAVLKKHGLTQAEVDSSLAYYSRHTRLLHDIYEHLAERLKDEAMAMGESESSLGQYGEGGTQGDTASIWRGEGAMVFMPQQPYNAYSFSMVADTTFHKGDRIILDFNSQFVYQEGNRNGMAVLAVTFGNDSTASNTLNIMGSQHYTTSIDDADSLGIKAVKGYFLLQAPNSPGESLTTLKLMVLQDIRLVRMHVRNRPPRTTAPVPAATSVRAEPATAPSGRSVQGRGVEAVHPVQGRPVPRQSAPLPGGSVRATPLPKVEVRK